MPTAYAMAAHDRDKLEAFVVWAAQVAGSNQPDPHLALRRIAEEAHATLRNIDK